MRSVKTKNLKIGSLEIGIIKNPSTNAWFLFIDHRLLITRKRLKEIFSDIRTLSNRCKSC